MRVSTKNLIKLLLISALPVSTMFAGNKDRTGQSGASELLINPWARSSGLHGLNSASVRGIESMRLNVAGMSFTKKTEVVFARTNWLSDSDIGINTIGISQKVGETGVIGIDIMAMNFGNIQVTTPDQPDGGIGTFKPQFINLGLAYSKMFSNSIYGGVAVRLINESIGNVSAQGIAIDAGIQYVTGPKENIKFGIALRNVGTPMRYGGDGLSFRTIVDGGYQSSVQQRSEKFELPALLNIGGAYDWHLVENTHRLTFLGNFTSNSFSRDQIGAGLEYGFREMFMARLGYRYEQGLLSSDKNDRTTSITGLAAGFTIELPTKENGPTFGIDYSYRTTNPFGGIHSIGVRVNL